MREVLVVAGTSPRAPRRRRGPRIRAVYDPATAAWVRTRDRARLTEDQALRLRDAGVTMVSIRRRFRRFEVVLTKDQHLPRFRSTWIALAHGATDRTRTV